MANQNQEIKKYNEKGVFPKEKNDELEEVIDEYNKNNSPKSKHKKFL